MLNLFWAFVLEVKFLDSKPQNWRKKVYLGTYFDQFWEEIQNFQQKIKNTWKCSNVKWEPPSLKPIFLVLIYKQEQDALQERK